MAGAAPSISRISGTLLRVSRVKPATAGQSTTRLLRPHSVPPSMRLASPSHRPISTTTPPSLLQVTPIGPQPSLQFPNCPSRPVRKPLHQNVSSHNRRFYYSQLKADGSYVTQQRQHAHQHQRQHQHQYQHHHQHHQHQHQHHQHRHQSGAGRTGLAKNKFLKGKWEKNKQRAKEMQQYEKITKRDTRRPRTTKAEKMIRHAEADAAWEQLRKIIYAHPRPSLSDHKESILQAIEKLKIDLRFFPLAKAFHACTDHHYYDNEVFHELIQAFCHIKQPKLAKKAFLLAREHNVLISDDLYSALIGFSQDPQQGLAYLDDIVEQGREPTLEHWNKLLFVCGFVNNMGEALKTLQTMMDKGVTPDSASYASVIAAANFRNDEDVEMALQMFDVMTEEGLNVNTTVYNALIDLAAKRGNLALATSLFEQVTAHEEVHADMKTFSCMIEAACRARRAVNGLPYLDQMCRYKFQDIAIPLSRILRAAQDEGRLSLGISACRVVYPHAPVLLDKYAIRHLMELAAASPMEENEREIIHFVLACILESRMVPASQSERGPNFDVDYSELPPPGELQPLPQIPSDETSQEKAKDVIMAYIRANFHQPTKVDRMWPVLEYFERQGLVLDSQAWGTYLNVANRHTRPIKFRERQGYGKPTFFQTAKAQQARPEVLAQAVKVALECHRRVERGLVTPSGSLYGSLLGILTRDIENQRDAIDQITDFLRQSDRSAFDADHQMKCRDLRFWMLQFTSYESDPTTEEARDNAILATNLLQVFFAGDPPMAEVTQGEMNMIYGRFFSLFVNIPDIDVCTIGTSLSKIMGAHGVEPPADFQFLLLGEAITQGDRSHLTAAVDSITRAPQCAPNMRGIVFDAICVSVMKGYDDEALRLYDWLYAAGDQIPKGVFFALLSMAECNEGVSSELVELLKLQYRVLYNGETPPDKVGSLPLNRLKEKEDELKRICQLWGSGRQKVARDKLFDSLIVDYDVQRMKVWNDWTP